MKFMNKLTIKNIEIEWMCFTQEFSTPGREHRYWSKFMGDSSKKTAKVICMLSSSHRPDKRGGLWREGEGGGRGLIRGFERVCRSVKLYSITSIYNITSHNLFTQKKTTTQCNKGLRPAFITMSTVPSAQVQ